MTTNGITGYVKFDDCECGKQGFRQERDAKAFMLYKKRQTDPVGMVECPVGSCFHVRVFNSTIRDEDDLKNWLTETAASAKQPRPALPPTRPLTHNLPLARSRVIELAPPPLPPPTPTPASSSEARSCPKNRYASKAMAVFVLSNMPEGRAEQRVYECNACGDWHLTSHEYDPSQIVEERLMTFGHEPHAISVVKGSYPDGKVASLTLRNAKGFVRIRAENFPQLASALASVASRPPTSTPRPSTSRESRPMRVLEMLRSREMTTSEIADELGVSTAQTRPLLAGMRKDGQIEKRESAIVRYGQNVSLWSLPTRSSCVT